MFIFFANLKTGAGLKVFHCICKDVLKLAVSVKIIVTFMIFSSCYDILDFVKQTVPSPKEVADSVFCLDPTYTDMQFSRVEYLSPCSCTSFVCMRRGWNITQNTPPADRFQKVCVSLDQSTDCALLRPRWWKWKIRGRPVQARVGQWNPPRPVTRWFILDPAGFFPL